MRLPKARVSAEPEPVEALPEFNGTVVYRCEPVLQFNAFTARTKQLGNESRALTGSEQFATAARIADGDVVVIESAAGRTERTFRVDPELKGTIALAPTFDTGLPGAGGAYRFEKVKIMKASNDE